MSSVSVSFRRSLAKCFSTSDFRSSMALSFARLLASLSLDLAMASKTPASSLLACFTHATSLCGSLMVFNAVSTSSSLCLVVSATRRDPSARLPQCFFERVSSALWSVSTTSLPSPRDAPIYNQVAPAISALHIRHQPLIFGPACLDPETGIFPSSQQWRSSCLQASSKESYRRGRSRTGYSRSCLRALPIGMAHFVVESINQALLLGLKFCPS